jgi:hypothetical protein
MDARVRIIVGSFTPLLYATIPEIAAIGRSTRGKRSRYGYNGRTPAIDTSSTRV